MELSSIQICRVLYEHVVLTSKRRERWKCYAREIGVDFNTKPAMEVYTDVYSWIKKREGADYISKIIIKSFNSIKIDNKHALLKYFQLGKITGEVMTKLEVKSERTAYRRLGQITEKIMREFMRTLQECQYESLCG